jgi:hypothetical protein
LRNRDIPRQEATLKSQRHKVATINANARELDATPEEFVTGLLLFIDFIQMKLVNRRHGLDLKSTPFMLMDHWPGA